MASEGMLPMALSQLALCHPTSHPVLGQEMELPPLNVMLEP